MQDLQLHYVFDPLCGWCYASAHALNDLSRAWPALLKLWPAGLFSEAGARELTLAWADYAWTNDKRIEAMTGQPFSDIYRERVLLGGDIRFGSAIMNRALTAVQKISPVMEPLLLDRLQVARYVDGYDTSRATVVARIAAAVLGDSGYITNEAELLHALEADADLASLAQARVRATQNLMKECAITGVPQLLISAGGRIEAVSSSTLYQGAGHVVDMLMSTHGNVLPAPLSNGA